MQPCLRKRFMDETAPSAGLTAQNGPPQASFGLQSLIGARAAQEDSVTVAPCGSGTLYGVFDGHGGAAVSTYLKHHMAEHVCTALRGAASGSGEAAAMSLAFRAADAAVSAGTDGGSTAVVVLISKERIVCANCGDSRAVLSSTNGIVELSIDHKPDLDSEEARISACGGRVVHTCSGARVMGMLAMTRAIGDRFLRPFGVIPEPDVKVQARGPGDEFLIIASDGLWDVISSVESVSIVRRCFERACGKGASRLAGTRIAARVLARAAIGKGSRDNTTVLVVDLQPAETPGPQQQLPGDVQAEAAAAVDATLASVPLTAASAFSAARAPETLPSLAQALSGKLSEALVQQQQQLLCRVASATSSGSLLVRLAS
ncbi:hypothetical protein FOA52_002517 [Chlamydomonas sp. UWO 241]|nr:hypothetical protein FOA52_002517 [Chlamydomonas sp. UWO 241]